jgi:hypothetical protein
MTDEETVASPQTDKVESETTSPSTSETQTAESPEMSEGTTLASPEDTEKLPRSEQRIKDLTHKVKELEEKASYWDQLNAVPPEAPPEDEDAPVTVDGIAEAVLRKQQTVQLEQTKLQAQEEMAKDAAAALAAHPELETDDELADIVVAYAEKNKMSFKLAADKIKQRMNQEQKKAEAKVSASNAQRAGASTPTGTKVANGELTPIDLNNMSEDEKAANWSQILANIGQ